LQAAETRGVEGLGRKALALERLLSIGRDLATLDLDTVLDRILSHVLDLSGTRRGAVLLLTEEGDLRPARAAVPSGTAPAGESFAWSRAAVEQALATGRVVAVEDLPASRHRDRTSVLALGLQAVVAIPLRTEIETLGVLYLDTDAAEHAVARPDAALLAAFGAQAAVALGNARRYRKLEDEVHLLKRALPDAFRFDRILYRSAAMDRVCRSIRQVMDTDLTVLIQGETGTGKELVARAIHGSGPRQAGRFLAENVGALPDELLESELFGHRRGAFSGAVEHKEGIFEAAGGGTVLLDEIGEASPALQVRLLRFLETKTFRRVGETIDRRADVRVLAATHRDLAADVRAGRFRADLYYRLAVFPIAVPPLRERPEDVEILVRHFVETANRDLGRNVQRIPAAVLADLASRPWPGNVRELGHAVQRLVLLSSGDELIAPARLDDRADPFPSQEPPSTRGARATADPEVVAPLADVEREHLERALAATGGNLSRAAALLGLKRGTLRWRLRKHGLG